MASRGDNPITVCRSQHDPGPVGARRNAPRRLPNGTMAWSDPGNRSKHVERQGHDMVQRRNSALFSENVSLGTSEQVHTRASFPEVRRFGAYTSAHISAPSHLLPDQHPSCQISGVSAGLHSYQSSAFQWSLCIIAHICLGDR